MIKSYAMCVGKVGAKDSFIHEEGSECPCGVATTVQIGGAASK